MTDMNTEVEIAVEITAFTENAILIESLTGEDVWIPKSQITDYQCDNCDNIDEATIIFIPEWLAIDNDLIWMPHK